MFGINPMELMIILMVALIVVGPKRLPEIGRTIGRAFSELRRVQEEVRDTIRFDLEDDEPEPPTRPVRRERSPDSPRTPSAAELASAAERERTAAPASGPDARPEVVPEVAPDTVSDAVPDAAPQVAPEVAPEVTAIGGEPTDAGPPGREPEEPDDDVGDRPKGPAAGVELPGDADSPNGSPKRPARDEAG
jgi:sec-independent protein translocase protein TatB